MLAFLFQFKNIGQKGEKLINLFNDAFNTFLLMLIMALEIV